MGIKQKLTLIVLLISVLPTLFLGIFVYSKSRDALTASTLNQLSTLASQLENRVVTAIDDYQARVKQYASRLETREQIQQFLDTRNAGIQNRLNLSLDATKQAVTDIEEITVADPNGTVISSTNPALVNTSLSADTDFAAGRKAFTPTRVIAAPDGRGLAVHYGPIIQNEELIGVVRFEFSTDRIVAITSDRTGLGTTGDPNLVARDAAGQAISLTPLRFDNNAAFKILADSTEKQRAAIQALMKNEQTYTDSRDYRGKEVLAATRYIDQTDWGLVVKVDREEAFAPIRDLRNLLLIFSLLLAAVMLFLVLEVTRSITRPLVRLATVTKKIRDGNLRERADVRASDEIGALGAAINDMAEKLANNQKDLERTVRERTQQLNDAQATARIGSWYWDAPTGKVQWSKEFYRIFRLSPKTAAKFDTLQPLIHPEDREKAQILLTKLAEEAKPFEQEFRLRFRNKETRIVQCKGEVAKQEHGKVLAMRGIVADITERRLAEQQAIELAAIVESTDDAVYSTDAKGRIANWNHGAERLYGYTAAEAVGQSVRILTPASHAGEVKDILNHVSQGLAIEQMQTIQVRQDGRAIDVALSVSPVYDETHKVVGTARIARDTTAQMELQKRQRDFVSIASHELRTPLTALSGYLSMIDLKTTSRPQIAKFLERAEAAAVRLSSLVEDLLSVARIEEDRVTLTETPISATSALKEILKNFEALTAAKKMKLTFVDETKPNDYITVDRGKFDQVMINLIDNAIKYTPAGGAVIITVSRTQKQVVITVQDTGIGIHAENLDRIYDKFYREYTEMSVLAGGTGLGLFITRELVERQRGELVISSEQGAGTTATVRFPRHTKKPAIPPRKKK